MTDGQVRVLAPISTVNMARRWLNSSRITAALLPPGTYGLAYLDALLNLFVAEEEARYLTVTTIDLVGVTSVSVGERWINILIQDELIDSKNELLALTDKGYALVIDILTKVFDAQRAIDHQIDADTSGIA